jgi:hypothetical protein
MNSDPNAITPHEYQSTRQPNPASTSTCLVATDLPVPSVANQLGMPGFAMLGSSQAMTLNTLSDFSKARR